MGRIRGDKRCRAGETEPCRTLVIPHGSPGWLMMKGQARPCCLRQLSDSQARYQNVRWHCNSSDRDCLQCYSNTSRSSPFQENTSNVANQSSRTPWPTGCSKRRRVRSQSQMPLWLGIGGPVHHFYITSRLPSSASLQN
jgi:hypothetical protein